jgi:hypothetical protein
MAIVLESQGKLDDAMELHRKALEIKKKTLGDDSSVASTHTTIWRLYWSLKESWQTGKYDLVRITNYACS